MTAYRVLTPPLLFEQFASCAMWMANTITIHVMMTSVRYCIVHGHFTGILIFRDYSEYRLRTLELGFEKQSKSVASNTDLRKYCTCLIVSSASFHATSLLLAPVLFSALAIHSCGPIVALAVDLELFLRL